MKGVKHQLANEVMRLLRQEGLAQDAAAQALGITPLQMRDLERGRLARFSVERLMEFLTHLGKDVEVRIAARPADRPRRVVQVQLVG